MLVRVSWTYRVQDNFRNFSQEDMPEYLQDTEQGPVSCYYWRASLCKSTGTYNFVTCVDS